MSSRSKSSRSSRFFAFYGLLLLSACANVFRDFPDKGSREYRMDKARVAIDEKNWDDAIDGITPVLEDSPDDPDVVYIAATAYAGRAGLRILTLFTELSSSADTKGLFLILAEHFTLNEGETLDLAGFTTTRGIQAIDDIETAKEIIETYGARAADRNNDINYIAFFVYASRIGVTLSRLALDPDSAYSLRTNFRGCHKVVAPSAAKTGLPNDAVDIVLTSLPRLAETASYVFGASTGVTSGIPSGLSFDPICATNQIDPTCLTTRALINVGKSEGGIGLGVGVENLCTSGVTP